MRRSPSSVFSEISLSYNSLTSPMSVCRIIRYGTVMLACNLPTYNCDSNIHFSSIESRLVWSSRLLSSFRDVVCSDKKNPIHFAMPRSLCSLAERYGKYALSIISNRLILQRNVLRLTYF